MLTYFLRRFLLSLLTLFAIATITFALMRLAHVRPPGPNDPTSQAYTH
jgi:ABC-type microcin C transport system permease subunit YejB